MTQNTLKIGAVGAGLGALAIWLLPPFVHWFAAPYQALAQERPAVARTMQPKEVTLTGRIVDLHGAITGEYATKDHARCTAQCIRSGVPAGLETETGLVVLGQGARGPAKTILPVAFEQVEVQGKLYEKAGVRYLDIKTVKKVGPERERPAPEDEDWPDEPADPDEPDDPDDPEGAFQP